MVGFSAAVIDLFAACNWRPLSSQEVRAWLAPYPENAGQRQRLRKALEFFAVRSHRGSTRGRPWTWRLKDEIVDYPGGPDSWYWEQHLHPFRSKRWGSENT